jgi:hypothetical protein
VDVAETVGGYWDVLRRYLYVAEDLGLLAAQAGLRPGSDICGEALPNIPGGDEAAGCPPARVGSPMEVFENLSPKVSGYQWAECAGGGVADEVKVVVTFCVMMRRPGLEQRACTCGQRIWRRAISGTGGTVCKWATPSVEQPGGHGFKPRLRSLLD